MTTEIIIIILIIITTGVRPEKISLVTRTHNLLYNTIITWRLYYGHARVHDAHTLVSVFFIPFFFLFSFVGNGFSGHD